MTLLTEEKLSLLQSYQQILKSTLIFLILNASTHNATHHVMCKPIILETMGRSLWTSASSEGPQCTEQRKFAWCTSGNIMEEKYVNDAGIWGEKPIGNTSVGSCVSMTLNQNESNAQLSLAACTDSKSFLCQVCKFTKKKISDG
jgi:hypothetical protein